MDIEFDSAKRDQNLAIRGIPFEWAAEFDFATAWVVEDDRRDYGEVRLRALGIIGDRLHALVFTVTESGIRVISLRKANSREVRRYDQAKIKP